MKKILITTLILATLFSCKPNSNESKLNTETTIKYTKIDTILNSVLKKYPNYLENTLVRNNAEKELKIKLDSAVDSKTFNKIAFKIFRLGKNPHGKGALVQFYTETNYSPNLLSDSFYFDVIGLIEEKTAASINEDDTYYIYCKNIKRINQTEVNILVNQTYYSTEVEIDEQNKFYGGVYLSTIDSLKNTMDEFYFKK